jgi:hypothetical protein
MVHACTLQRAVNWSSCALGNLPTDPSTSFNDHRLISVHVPARSIQLQSPDYTTVVWDCSS